MANTWSMYKSVIERLDSLDYASIYFSTHLECESDQLISFIKASLIAILYHLVWSGAISVIKLSWNSRCSKTFDWQCMFWNINWTDGRDLISIFSDLLSIQTATQVCKLQLFSLYHYYICSVTVTLTDKEVERNQLPLMWSLYCCI